MPVSTPVSGVRLSEVFSKGNTKLGRSVLTFSLPAVVTCPGSSALCRKLCYADRPQSRFSSPEVQAAYRRNLQFSMREDFHSLVTDLLGGVRRDRPLVRLHVSGDYYNTVYAWKWLQVVKQSRRTTFWCYTRSWRIPEIRQELEKLALQPNMFLWYSYDRETGSPPASKARTAYMQVAADDVAEVTPDLYFREHAVRGDVVKRIDGTLVCPPENGISKSVQCENCRVCLTDPALDPKRRTRIALPLA